MLRVNHVSIHLGETRIVEDCSFTVKNGEHLVITGASGSGKTTLLAALTGLIPLEAGEVWYDECPFHTLSEREKDHFRGRSIGLLFQNLHLIPVLNARQNIQLAIQCSGADVPLEELGQLMRQLDISYCADRPAHQLSGGEQQRVALARALICRPKWLFCDEPTSALDDDNTDRLLNTLMAQAAHRGTSVIVVTHDRRVLDNLSYVPHLKLEAHICSPSH